jgi:hypothetical protein
MTYFPSKGDWVRWVTTSSGREGQVVEAIWPSFTVKWLGVEQPQVFPWGQMYFNGEQSSASMEPIRKPRGVTAKASTPSGAAMTTAQAASALGITQRALRMKLRSGKIKGLQRDGRWVAVYL